MTEVAGAPNEDDARAAGAPVDPVPATGPVSATGGRPPNANGQGPTATAGPPAPAHPGADATATLAEPGTTRRGRRRWIPVQLKWTITAIILIFVFEYLVVPDIASARKSIGRLEHVNVGLLLVGVALELGALLSYAELTRVVLSPDAPSRFQVFRVNMSSLAVSHIVPGGTAPGGAVAYRLLTDLGVPPTSAGFALALQGVGSAVVLNALFWVALLISIPLTGYNRLYGFAALAGVLFLSLFAGVVLLLTRGSRSADDVVRRIAARIPFVNADSVIRAFHTIAERLHTLLSDRSLLKRAVLWATANWALDAASLWLFIFAFGHTLSPIDLLVAYGLANVLAVIPLTPGGLGVIEGVLIPTLHGFGVPVATDVLGVLSWRLVNFWIPIPAGGISYLSLQFGPHARRARALRNGRPHEEPAPG